ncbi:hypothetical protein Taro_004458 [Colocasia esculenta]|uniref:FLZ-type domain-containing protein n=1 Tax=Colocasia esculenta TaxID=4460 RepID=A0A843TRR5_COLES|nr:hypothetical protein [Colocasia esculenta]
MEEPHHFLDAYFLCRITLQASHNIFMYRGDMPFCSEECRQEQIEVDEARDRDQGPAAEVAPRFTALPIRIKSSFS